MAKRGRPKTKPKLRKQIISVRLEPALLAKLESICIHWGTSRSQAISYAIARYVKEEAAVIRRSQANPSPHQQLDFL